MHVDIFPFVRFVSKTTYFMHETVVARDCRMLYVVSGQGSFTCDGKTYALAPNTLIFYPYEKPYRIRAEEGMLFYTLNFDFTQDYTDVNTMMPQAVAAVPLQKGLHTIPEEWSDIFSQVICFEHAFWAEEEIKQIYEESVNQSCGYVRIRDSLLNILLLKIYRKKLQDESHHPLCVKIKDLICQDLGMNVKGLAAQLNYHPFYISVVFKKHEGCTLHQYLKQQRLKKATALISTTQMPLEEIACMCGFSSQSHLSTMFKRDYHVSPGRFRRQT